VHNAHSQALSMNRRQGLARWPNGVC